MKNSSFKNTNNNDISKSTKESINKPIRDEDYDDQYHNNTS